MALPVKRQLTYWGIATAVFVVTLWMLGDVILPFVLGAAVAYCLDPIADMLERVGFSRVLATVTITLVALFVLIIVSLLILPTLVQQLSDLIEVLPTYISSFGNYITQRFPDLLDGNSQLSQTTTAIAETLQSKLGTVLSSVLNSATGVINAAVLVFLVPVITFYLLMDWDRMVAEIDSLLPRDYAPILRQLANEINLTLAAFIRGQGTVCLILGTYYAVGLMVVGLQFGLVVGFVAGLISFIPYVGALVGGVLAIGIALFQFWGEWVWIGAVAGVFFFGQMLEGNVLTPKLVGGSVGLHPVWLIFALSVFGSLFGFVGMLVAVPVSAAIGVIARYGVAQYRNSHLYQGASGASED
ncbi:MAG: AI-2E family transporter [Marinosulfonomonas sp.]